MERIEMNDVIPNRKDLNASINWGAIKEIGEEIKEYETRGWVINSSICGNTRRKLIEILLDKGYEIEDGYTANGRKKLTIRW